MSKTATKADKRRFNIITQHIGCVACRKLGLGFQPADAHHLLHGYRRGHQDTIPLCPYHHRGVHSGHWEKQLGPSLAHNAKAFRRRFGTDDELLEYTNRLIEDFEGRTIGGPA